MGKRQAGFLNKYTQICSFFARDNKRVYGLERGSCKKCRACGCVLPAVAAPEGRPVRGRARRRVLDLSLKCTNLS